MRFRLSSTLRRPKTLMDATVDSAVFVTVFKNLRFQLSTLETGCFKTIHFHNTPLSKPFPTASTVISVFGRFRVDDRRQHIKQYAFSNEDVFSNENALLWSGANTRTQVFPKNEKIWVPDYTGVQASLVQTFRSLEGLI